MIINKLISVQFAWQILLMMKKYFSSNAIIPFILTALRSGYKNSGYVQTVVLLLILMIEFKGKMLHKININSFFNYNYLKFMSFYIYL